MKRRHFVLLASCAAAARSDSRDLLGLLADPAALAGLGRAYLAQHPAAAQALSGAILGTLPGLGSLRAEVADRIRADYRAGLVTCADGWVLSVTEARLCALAALA